VLNISSSFSAKKSSTIVNFQSRYICTAMFEYDV
jgi:hypothetical protein